MTERWRYRCPRGHNDWRPQADGYYCKQCKDHFNRLTDAKTGKKV